VPKGYWRDAENRRKYFIDYAMEEGFDPIDIQTWRNTTVSQVVEKKVN